MNKRTTMSKWYEVVSSMIALLIVAALALFILSGDESHIVEVQTSEIESGNEPIILMLQENL